MKNDMLMDKIEHLERKLLDSELSKIREKLKSYQTEGEINSYKEGLMDAVRFLAEYPDAPTDTLDLDLLNGLEGSD